MGRRRVLLPRLGRVEFLGQDVARAADLPSSRAALEALIQRNAAAGIPVPPGLP